MCDNNGNVEVCQEKTCNGCGNIKKINLFAFDGKNNRFDSKCRDCRSDHIKTIPNFYDIFIKDGVEFKRCKKCQIIKETKEYSFSQGSPCLYCKECKPEVTKDFSNYKSYDTSKDDPNNEQIKIDRLNGWKLCLGCNNRKELYRFKYKHGCFSNKCDECKNKGIKIGKGYKILIKINEDGNETRECCGCHNFKVFAEFSKSKNRNITGYHDKCKICSNEKIKQAYYRRKAKGIVRKKVRNKEKAREQKKRQREKNRSNPVYKLNARISGGIRSALVRDNFRKNGRHWETFVDYTVQEAKIHLESLFTESMNWNKFCSGEIHIDHILPIELFEYDSPESKQFKYCWSLKNLQPLWRMDNIKKYDFLPNGKQASKMSIIEKKEYLISMGLGSLFD